MRAWFRNRSERLLDKELRSHVDEQVDAYVAAGMPREEAERKVRLEFGHLDQVKEECRDVRPFVWLDRLGRDVRFALRRFARSPGFTAVCLVTLALGIGANGTVFSLVNEVALTPPPYPNPDSLVVIEQSDEHLMDDISTHMRTRFYPLYAQREALRSIDDVAVLQLNVVALYEGGDPESITSAQTSDNFVEVLRVSPLLGRWFSASEARDLSAVVVLTHRLWSRRFDRDPNIVGRTIRLSVAGGQEAQYEIIGVLPARPEARIPFRLRGLDFELFMPYDVRTLENNRRNTTLTIARLAPGALAADAAAELIARQQSLYPELNHNNGGRRMIVQTFADRAVEPVRVGLQILVMAVGCVLLIVCANLAGLLLTRSAERKHEMAIRSSLGAGRWTMVSQTLVETGMLALSGCVLGLLAAWAGIRTLKALRFAALSDVPEVGLDLAVVAYCAALSVLAAVLIGALPAWSASRASVFSTLRQTTATARSGGGRLRNGLVVAQIALSLVLAVGSGLLIHSMGLLLTADPGYDSTNVISLSVTGRDQGEVRVAFWRQILGKVRALPGVMEAASVDHAPPERNITLVQHEIVGEPQPPQGVALRTNSRSVSGDYFALLGIPVLEGRGFSRAVVAHGSEVVVSRAFAERYWPASSAVGRRLRMIGPEPFEVEIVGVVEDARQMSLRDALEPILYRQTPGANELLVKTTGDPGAMIDAIKHAVRQVDPNQTFRSVQTLEERRSQQNAEPRFYMYLLSWFAGLSLILVLIGLYSVASQAATTRTQEIGLRMAIGARSSQILFMIARQGLTLAVTGMAIGLALSLALSKYLQSWLYGVTPTDPLTFGLAAAVLALIAWVATVIPALRAARLDPIKALRYE